MKRRLNVKCMKCGKEWTKECTFKWSDKDYSSSFCRNCFREVIGPLIRKKQRKEGFTPCFGKIEYSVKCEETKCKYRDFCLEGGANGKSKKDAKKA